MSSRTESSTDEVAPLAVITASGEIDVATAMPLREELTRAERAGANRIVLDLSAVSFMDSTGLGVLVGALRRLRESDGDLFLVLTNPHVLRVFAVTHLDRVFTILPTCDEAVGRARGQAQA